MEANTLASGDTIGRNDVIKAVQARHYRLSGSRKKRSNAGHAGRAMFAGGGGDGGGIRGKDGSGGGHGKGRGHGNGKGGRRRQQERRGESTNEDGGGSAAAASGNGSSGKVTEGSTPEARCYMCERKDNLKANCTRVLCSRCPGRGYPTGVCPASTEKRCSVCHGRGTLLISVPHRKKKLSWPCRTTTVMMVQSRLQLSRPKGQASAVMFWGRMGEGETAWQVGDEAWLCDSGASAHMTPSADGMVKNREQNSKARIADVSTLSIKRYGDINFVFRSGNVLMHV